MINKETISKLKDFSLNSYEAKIWCALLLKGIATAGNLSDIADVPRSRCYDVLESLEKKGFIIVKIGRPIQYIAISPSEAIERVKIQVLRDTEERVNMIDNVKKTDLMKQLNSLHSSGSNSVPVGELTGILKSKKNIYAHLNVLLKNHPNEFLLSTDKSLEEEKTLFTSTNNTKVRILADKNNENEKTANTIKNASIKLTKKPLRFCIVDDKALLFLTDGSDETNESALWINSDYVVNSLRNLFELQWKS